MELKNLIQKLNKAGKIDKFACFADIMKLLALNQDYRIYSYFSRFQIHLQEYLQYDPKPANTIKAHITTCFLALFIHIKDKNDVQKFLEFIPLYKQYYHLIINSVEKARLLKNLGYLFWMNHDLDSSIECFKESLELANYFQDNSLMSRYTNLGYIYECRGDIAIAEEYYLQGIKFAQKNHFQEAMFLAYNAMGRLNYNLNYYSKAQKYFQAALEICDMNEPQPRHIPTVMNLASTHVFLKQYDQAVQCLKIVQQDWVKDSNPDLYYSSFTNMAVYYIQLGELQKARISNEKALEYAQKQNDPEILFSYYHNLASINLNQNLSEKSLHFSQKALAIAQKNNDLRQQALACQMIATACKNLGDYKKAIKYLQNSEKFYRKKKNYPDLLEILHFKASCYSALHNFKKASSCLMEYIKLNQLIQKKKSQEENFLANQKIIKASQTNHLFFNTGYTTISRELSQCIGLPIIGQSPQIQKVIQDAILIAGNQNASVLLRGESGTGKELIARLIHYASDRKNAPFVPINSATLTSGIAQSTLFGHEKGAFTGAVATHQGLFEQAENGSVFLDEIADMPPDIQAYLLRIIEDKKIRRLGAKKCYDSNFRIISATNANIDDLLKNKSFRLDLLNRINTFEIIIPPLRDRVDDIPLLIDYYLKDIATRLNRKIPAIEAKVIDLLLSYNYPGNVREFVNIIEKLVIFCKNDLITVDDICFLKFDCNEQKTSDQFQTLNLKINEDKLIRIAMEKCGNVQKEAAKLLGIPDYTLSRKLKKVAARKV